MFPYLMNHAVGEHSKFNYSSIQLFLTRKKVIQNSIIQAFNHYHIQLFKMISLKYLILFCLVIFAINSQAQNTTHIKDLRIGKQINKYGIEGHQAPELKVPIWIDAEGEKRNPVTLKDYEGKFKVIYCFQAWCPGCHSRGLPALQKMTEALKENDQVVFLAIQTVFEGAKANTFERVKEIQKEYDLKIPFGHDVGDKSTQNVSATMNHYRTGGTPWFILVDQEGTVIFNDYHLNTDKAIEYLKGIKSKAKNKK